MAKWLADNWGNLASVIGVFLSALAFRAANRAQIAAAAAQSAVERRSLAQDLRDALEDVGFVKLLIDSARWDLAAHSCYRIVTDMTFLETRWNGHLDAASRKQFTLAISQLDTINSQLRKFRETAPTSETVDRLSQSILRVNTILSAEVGKHEAIDAQSVIHKD
jgi:hypothetical protein